jgi:hypothetical protein
LAEVEEVAVAAVGPASAPVEVVVAEGAAAEAVEAAVGLERLNMPTRHISMPH